MTTRGDKIKATKQRKATAFGKQTIMAGEFTIQRLDELNWTITGPGVRQPNYYGSAINALRALPAKMLDSEAKGTLGDVQRSLLGIEASIEESITSGIWTDIT